MIKVLFADYKYSNRLPLVTGIFKYMLEKDELADDFWVKAKTTPSIGKNTEPSSFVKDKLETLNIDLNDIEIDKIVQDDYRLFDFIIAMDQHQLKLIKRQAGIYRDKVYLINDISLTTKVKDVSDLGSSQENDDLFEQLINQLILWITMFKENKLLHFIDLDDYLIREKPEFLRNPQYYEWDTEQKRFIIRESAPDDIIESYRAFYEEEEQNEN